MERSVPAHIDELQQDGIYTVTRLELEERTGAPRRAVMAAVGRLKRSGRLVEPRRGFLVIVPLEYRSVGSLPASWFIDDLMRFLGQPYYVGLLTAAAIHGAAHHRPQEFQVVTDRPTRPITVGRVRIRFVQKSANHEASVQEVKTETGTMRVSTPEETAFDLVRYAPVAGHLDNVATVLADLAPQLDPERVVEVAGHFEESVAQKLGYLLDLVGATDRTAKLHAWLTARNPSRAPLVYGPRPFAAPVDPRWNVVVNRTIEVER